MITITGLLLIIAFSLVIAVILSVFFGFLYMIYYTIRFFFIKKKAKEIRVKYKNQKEIDDKEKIERGLKLNYGNYKTTEQDNPTPVSSEITSKTYPNIPNNTQTTNSNEGREESGFGGIEEIERGIGRLETEIQESRAGESGFRGGESTIEDESGGISVRADNQQPDSFQSLVNEADNSNFGETRTNERRIKSNRNRFKFTPI